MKTKGLFWLASYPKSGNTWVRSFLANLLGDQKSFDINNLNTGSIASSRQWVEEALGVDINELSHNEIDQLRPAAYRYLASNSHVGVDGDTAINEGKECFHKVHDAYTFLPSGEPLFPVEATQGAVILVRNPLDIALSYANHSAISVECAVKEICYPEHSFCGSEKRQVTQLRQKLFNWGKHVQSWIEADIPKIVIRYEDLKTDPFSCFSQIVSFFQLDYSKQKIEAAIEQSAFEKLKAMEDEQGFKEKASHVKAFFRKGEAGDWQGKLTELQINQIIDANREMMLKLGYLDGNGQPLVQPERGVEIGKGF